MKKVISLLITAIIITACVGESVNSNQQKYYSAAHTGYYLIESNVNPENESELYFSVVDQSSSYVYQTPLSLVSSNNYTFKQGSTSGTVTIKNNLLGVSYSGVSDAWIDLATTTNNIESSLPNGSYNLICDQTNISACNLKILNNQITLVEFSTTGQPITLCSNSLAELVPANTGNQYLYSFTCGVNGGSSSGTWYALPINIRSEHSIMLSEYNPTSNDSSDTTDELSFPVQSINPTGTYQYLYDGGSLSGVGVSTASISAAGVINPIAGSCSGSACALVPDQYYLNNDAQGFAWYNVNLQNNYNLTGSDKMKVYQDSFFGFYF